VIEEALAPGGRRPLVIEAISLDAPDRIGLTGSVIWLAIEERTAEGSTAVLMPLTSEANEEATLVGRISVGSAVI
jgi:hypothetical protein